MTTPSFRMRWRHEGEFAELAIELDGEIVGGVKLDGGELEDLIKTLMRLRMSIPEPVGTESDFNARIESIVSPVIHTRDQGDEGLELLVRHPGYGWLSFLLKESMQKGLIANLLRKTESTKDSG